MHYGRYGRDSEDSAAVAALPRLPGPRARLRLRIVRRGGVRRHRQRPARSFDRSIGSRVAVASAELRFPLARCVQPPDLLRPVADRDGALRRRRRGLDERRSTPRFFGSGRSGVRDWVKSTGVALRFNLLGYIVGEVDYVKPIDRPEKGWYWQFNFIPGLLTEHDGGLKAPLPDSQIVKPEAVGSPAHRARSPDRAISGIESSLRKGRAISQRFHEGALAVRLFIGNLPYGASEADLRAHFAAVAEPSHVVMPVDRETGRPRGFAFVEFAERAVAEEVIKQVRRTAVPGAQPRRQRGACPRGSSAAASARAAASAARDPAAAVASAVPVPAARRRWLQWRRRRRLRRAAPGGGGFAARGRWRWLGGPRGPAAAIAAPTSARRRPPKRLRGKKGTQQEHRRAVRSRSARAAASTPWTISRTTTRSRSTMSRPVRRTTKRRRSSTDVATSATGRRTEPDDETGDE